MLAKGDGGETAGPQKNEGNMATTPLARRTLPPGPSMKKGRVSHSPPIGKTVPPSQIHARPVHQVHVPPWAILGHPRTLSGPLRDFAE